MERQCLEGKVPIDAATNVFNARSVYTARSRPDDIQTFGHDRMKAFHQCLCLSGLGRRPRLCKHSGHNTRLREREILRCVYHATS